MPALGPAVARNGLAISDARDLRRRLDAVLTLQLLERDVKVDITEARDDELLCLPDPFDVQRRILLAQAGQPAGDLLLVASRLRSDGDAVCRPRQVQGRQRPTILHAQG